MKAQNAQNQRRLEKLGAWHRASSERIDNAQSNDSDMAGSARVGYDCNHFYDPLHGKTQTGQSLLQVFGKPSQMIDRRFLTMAGLAEAATVINLHKRGFVLGIKVKSDRNGRRAGYQ